MKEPKKMGRPTLGNKKFCQVYVGFSPDEKAVLEKMACKAERSLSSFLRLIIIDAVKYKTEEKNENKF